MPPEPPNAPASVAPRPGTEADGRLLALMERACTCGTWSLTVPQGCLRLSDNLAVLLEVPPAKAAPFVGLADFFAPESRAMMQAALDACIVQGTAFDLEAQVVTGNANYLMVRSLGQAIRDDHGAVVRVQGVIQDLTDKKRAEQESLSVTMRLSTTLASITEAFATLDRQGRFTYLNSESERMLQRKSVQLLGKQIWQELDESDSSQLRQGMQEALAGGLHLEFEDFYPHLGKWLALRAYPFEEGIAVYLRDVTSLRRSQEQLLLQTSISRLNDLVLITEAGPIDEPGPRIVFVNDAFEKHTGYSREEVLGKAPRMLQGPLTQRPELDRIREALIQVQPVRAELVNYKKDGTLYWIELEIVPVDYFNRSLTHWVAVARDITERKAAEDEIEHLAFYDTLTQLPNRQLLMDRLKSTLTRGAKTHDIGALMFSNLFFNTLHASNNSSISSISSTSSTSNKQPARKTTHETQYLSPDSYHPRPDSA